MSKAEELSQKYTADQLWKKFDALPEKIRDVIFDEKTPDIIAGIAKSNGVIEQANNLERYIQLILAGIVPITLLRETVQEELQIDEGHARKIAMEIRDKIFMQVKDELRKIHNLE